VLVASWSQSSLSMTQHVPLALDLAFKARRAILLLGGFLGILLLRRAAALRPPIVSALLVGLVAGDLASINHGLNLTVSCVGTYQAVPIVDLTELRKTRQRVFDYETSFVPGQRATGNAGAGTNIKIGRQLEFRSLQFRLRLASRLRVLRMNVPMVEHVGTLSGIDGIFRKSDDALNNATTTVPRDGR